MVKSTVCVKMSEDLKDKLEYDSWIIYNRDRKLSEHMLTILEKYMETRPPLPIKWKELIEDKKDG